MIIDAAFGKLLNLLIQITLLAYFQIGDLTAIVADKMIVRIDVTVESVKRTAHSQFMNKTIFDQDIQIAIDIAQTEFGKFLAQLIINPHRRRMAGGIAQKLQNPLALAAGSISTI